MEIRELPQSLEQLLGQIAALPADQRAPLEGLVAETVAHRKAVRAAALEIEDALADIRLNIKYLSFDLEATRRECDHLRQRLENRDNDLD